MKLSPHFSFEELTNTSHKEYLEANRKHGRRNIEKLKDHADFLETVRDLLGCPIIISSGIRCPELNKKVGGVPSSQHMHCEASDIIPTGISIPDAFEKIYKSNLMFDQLILERSRGKEWIHISYTGFADRRQALVYDGKRYTVYKGQQ